MILLDSVTKKYAGDAEPALDDISLHIEPNEFVFLVGKSGAGKSTLMKMITKEETPDSGKIIVGGIDLDYVKKRHIPGYRRRLGVVFQDFKLLPRRTVYENVAFALEIAGMSGKEIRRTVPKVLELVDLLPQAKKFPRQLSGGQQQRVSIARSVARQPKILIADEPTANLDKLTTKEIIDLLKKINDFGTTILVTTHNELIVNNLQKRVVTMKHGRIVDDQKNNGIYKLDETPMPVMPVRSVQMPGHALRPNSPIILSSRLASAPSTPIQSQPMRANAPSSPARPVHTPSMSEAHIMKASAMPAIPQNRRVARTKAITPRPATSAKPQPVKSPRRAMQSKIASSQPRPSQPRATTQQPRVATARANASSVSATMLPGQSVKIPRRAVKVKKRVI
ncbi:cell division ATP-binding protein FtsE [Candidatus Saccharibacteria bacterium]|nr:cell division ATP-binding protein FtsE [Candidatus Saccharibacteria bacterium]